MSLKNVDNNMINTTNNSNKNNDARAVIIAFDDGWKSQFTDAKPILIDLPLKEVFLLFVTT